MMMCDRKRWSNEAAWNLNLQLAETHDGLENLKEKNVWAKM